MARLRRVASLAMISGFLAMSCTALSSRTPSAPIGQTYSVSSDEACGNPIRLPVSQQCIAARGWRVGPLLKRKSDLVMAVWRACPAEDACEAVEQKTPACKKRLAPNLAAEAKARAEQDCQIALSADYSCDALRRDPDYVRQGNEVGRCLEDQSQKPGCAPPSDRHAVGGKAWEAASARYDACWDRCFPEGNFTAYMNDRTPECGRAQAALADFQTRVNNAMLDAEMKNAFAPPQPLVISPSQPPPIIIQQTAPTNFLAPPWVPSRPVLTNCNSFGGGVNCITH